MPSTAAKSLGKAARSSAALPQIVALAPIYQSGVNLRRGQLVMVAAVPGSGKSAFVEWLVSSMDVPALYFSADQDPWTSVTRLAATLSGDTTDEVGKAVASREWDRYAALLKKSKISFCFDSNPSVEDIGHEVDAYVETWDEWPEVIVVDNLVNVEGSGELQTDQWIVTELHGLARATGACVIVLVHASEVSTRDVFAPPTRRDIINKLSKFPELIFTIASDPDKGEFKIAVVKAREAKADPKAERPYTIGVDMARCTFTAQPVRTWASW